MRVAFSIDRAFKIFSVMKKYLACLTIGLLICAGIRAPETHEFSRGICLSGAVLEKVADSSPNEQELRKATSNPLLLHSGFAPSAHPFDFPETLNLSGVMLSDVSAPHKSSFSKNSAIFPPDRPPITLFL